MHMNIRQKTPCPVAMSSPRPPWWPSQEDSGAVIRQESSFPVLKPMVEGSTGSTFKIWSSDHRLGQERSQWLHNRKSKASDLQHKSFKEPLWMDSCYNPGFLEKEEVGSKGMDRAKASTGQAWPNTDDCDLVNSFTDRKFSYRSGVEVTVVNAKQPRESIGWVIISSEEALTSLEWTPQMPSVEDIMCILQKCKKEKNVAYGKRVHAYVCNNGLEAHRSLGNHLIPMLVECGSMCDAVDVFNRLDDPNEYAWTSLLMGYIVCGESRQALYLYRKMQEDCVHPSKYTFAALLKACSRLKDVKKGQEIHAEVARKGLEDDPFLSNTLLDMYAKCGSLAKARDVFDKLAVRDVVSWTALMAGYAQHGLGEEALDCFQQMQLDGISPNIVSWNALITGYAQQGLGEKALKYFEQMQLEGVSPNAVTLVCSLKACGSIGAIDKGREIHFEIAKKGLDRDPFVGNTLVDMYAKFGSSVKARELFDKLPVRNVVSWNALMSGYVENGLGEEALRCLRQMQLEGVFSDAITFVCSLKACGSLGAINKGREIHDEIARKGLERESCVGSTLVDMYAKCGSLAKAREVLDKLPIRDIVSWTALIAGYAEHGLGEEALNCFEQMQREGVAPNAVTFICGLKACGNTEAVDKGHEIHVEIARKGLERDPCVGNTLVDMYAKCGMFSKAWEAFDKLPVRNVVSWTALITGYSQHGLGEEALNCFQHMQLEGVSPNIVSWNALIAGYAQLGESEIVFYMLEKMRGEGLQPDGVTFVSVLTACSHAGRVDKGQNYFEAMIKDYGITPNIEHHTCIVDLVGRAGQLEKAVAMVQKMPFQPDLAVWHNLLGACRKWADADLGRHAFEHAMQLDEKDPAVYILMSNIYADG